MEPSNPETIRVKVRSVLEEEHIFEVSEETKILELKTMIESRLGESAQNQKLIFEGRILEDEQTLREEGVKNENSILLVVHERTRETEEAVASPPNEELFGTPTINPPNQVISALLDFFTDNQIENAQNTRIMNIQQRTFGFPTNAQESLEVIRQNLLSVLKFSCGQRRNWQVGQWLDVKDTINQWLEAEVLEADEARVFIHYNGWGSVWDEWIENDSPRLAPFRTHTPPSPTAPYISPSPATLLDGHLRKRPPIVSSIDVLIQAANLLKFVIEEFEELSRLQKESEEARETHSSKKQAPNSECKAEAAGLDHIREESEDLLTMQNAQDTENETDRHFSKQDMSETKKRDIEEFNEKKMDIVSLKDPKEFEMDRRSLSSLQIKNSQKMESAYLARNLSPNSIRSRNSFESLNLPEQEEEKKNYAEIIRKKVKKLAPILDRLGRALVDIAPHIAMLSAPVSAFDLPSHTNLSTMTQDGSANNSVSTLRLFQRFRNQNEPSSIVVQPPTDLNRPRMNSDRPLAFQVPVMLTPSEILNAQTSSRDINEGHVDMNITAELYNEPRPKKSPTRNPSSSSTELENILRKENRHNS